MFSKLPQLISLILFFVFFYGSAQDNYWQKQTISTSAKQASFSEVNASKATVFSLQEDEFIEDLTRSSGKGSSKTTYFPNEKGSLVAYEITESSVMSTELALKYPDIKSYVGQNLNDNSSKVHFSVSHQGVQAMFTSSETDDSWYIQKTESEAYLLYSRTDKTSSTDDGFTCRTTEKVIAASNLSSNVLNTGTLTTYRLAVSATGEYTQYHGGNVADALAAIVATVTRLNVVFNTDLGITLELVANTDDVIYTDADNDPYSDSNSWADEVHDEIVAVIGSDNFDIGHLFSQGDNHGFSDGKGTMCDTEFKGAAYTSHEVPTGDAFDIEYVAHEMGHQLGANHTFSYSDESTNVQAEPGSGSTIMSYAGITDENDVAISASPYFHYHSIAQMNEYLETLSCGESTSSGNSAPEVSTPDSFYIPIGTAFFLEGTATDVDTNDALTYNWEQIDDGLVTYSTFGSTNSSGANFRSLPPTSSPIRYFPKMEQVIAGELTQSNPTVIDSWETVSTIKREMNFALTVRDNALNGGEHAFDFTEVQVTEIAGPFTVNSQATNEVYTAGDTQTIAWDVSNTYAAPINTEEVKIMLSIDGGTSFTILLADNVSNDGEHQIILPNVNTSTARIMVQAIDNVYFAVNASDFTINDADFILDFSTLEYEVCQNDALTVNFNYEPSSNFTEITSFSITELPAGLGASFSEVSTNENATIAINFTGTASTSPGQYTIPILAESASLSKTTELILTINSDEITDIVLQTPTDNNEQTSLETELIWEENTAHNFFEVEIATNESFTAIVESASTTSNSYKPSLLEANTSYYWRVSASNSCVTGVFGDPYKFTTAGLTCGSKSASGLPLEISVVGQNLTTSSIIFEDDVTIRDLNVTLKLDHTYFSDITVVLTSPQGTEVFLLDYIDCEVEFDSTITLDDDTSTIFDCDDSLTAIGTYQPIDALSSFNGESLKGEWILSIQDYVDQDGGNLSSFTIDYCSETVESADADNDGVLDAIDLCLETLAGATVDENGCEIIESLTCGSKSASDLPLEISDVDQPLITSSIIFEDDVTISDLTVTLKLDHTYFSDISVVLTSPKGTEVFLLDYLDCDVEFDSTVTLDDDTSTIFDCDDSLTASGTYQSVDALSSFNGESLKGEWILSIQDYYNGDGGNLSSFTIDYCSETVEDTDADNDGVLDATDLCLTTPAGATVNENGCEIYEFTAADFNIDTQDPLCATSNDGQINITATLDLEYQVLINGVTIEEGATANNFIANELASGSYDICIEANNGANTYTQYCVEVVINNTTESCDTDADNDGVLDDTDLCLETPAGVSVDENGCEVIESSDCGSKSASDLPLEISDVDQPLITSSIIFEDDVTISDLTVTLKLDHTYFSDISVILTSPEGTEVFLLDYLDCDVEFDSTVTLDDDTSTVFDCDDSLTASGTYQSVDDLSSFNGESLKGEWILSIQDYYNGDGGNLSSFTIDYCSETVEDTDADNDGVLDAIDLCLETPAGAKVDENGCEVIESSDCGSKSASDLPQEISDVDQPLITSSIIFEDDVTISDLTVTLKLDHTYFSDISVVLTSPEGTEVFLLDYLDCDVEFDSTVTLDDDTSTIFDCDNSLTASGTYQSVDALSSFNGESLKGEWILSIQDYYNGDGGNLSSFTIDYCSETVEDTDADNDGVLDTTDLCLATPSGATVNENGCEIYEFTAADFNIDTQDSTCANSNDGQIDITATLDLEYQVLINGATIDEGATANNFIANELASGSYDICIEANNGANSYTQYCVEVVINNTTESCDKDSDNDGVPDTIDLCLETLAGATVDENGCEVIESSDCGSKSAGDLPLEISVDGQPLITSSIIFEDDVTISDLNVTLKLDHTYFSDITVILTSPEGTDIVLLDYLDCEVAFDATVTLDDDTSTIFDCDDSLTATGTYQSIDALSSFNGESLKGEWILSIQDYVDQDGGNLHSFTIDYCSETEEDTDADNDGVVDTIDLCLETPAGAKVDENGCEIIESSDCGSKSASDLPLEISDVDKPLITSSIIFEDDLTISDLNVTLKLDHTYFSDITAVLTSPEGTRIILFEYITCDSELDTIITLDDDTSAIFDCDDSLTASGTYQSIDDLSSFNGESLKGEWILSIQDYYNGDGGNLSSFKIDYCSETEEDTDADNDGVLDTIDLCLETPAGTTVNENGCEIYSFSGTDFSISTQHVTCDDSDNGAIKIVANVAMNYEVQFTSDGLSLGYFFNEEYELNDLKPGVYTVCIEGDNDKNTFEAYCFETVIEEAERFSVLTETDITEKTIALSLSGATEYTVVINDDEITTSESELSFNLEDGLNTIQVFTENTCQEAYEEKVLISKDILVYPNPFDSELSVFFNSRETPVTLTVYSETGRMVSSSVHEAESGTINIELGVLAIGMYYVVLEDDDLIGVSKLIKR